LSDVIDDMPKVTAIAPWFGGKRTLAPIIIEELGPHSSYWEPFCGSMAVLIAKPPCKMETVNDLHGDLINLARVIQSPDASALYRRLRRVLLHEDFVLEARERLEDLPEVGVERAFWFFLHSWIVRNGNAGCVESGQTFVKRFTSNGGGPATRLTSAVKSIPAWRRRMRSVQIMRMDAFEMLEKVEDKPGGVIYIDPPYMKKSSQYLHDFDWLSHRRLAKLLHRFTQTRIVVSYYAHPDLASLYPGWTHRECTMNKALAIRKKGETKDAPELLIINGPSLAKDAA
jgi:DNA adenine methylase